MAQSVIIGLQGAVSFKTGATEQTQRLASISISTGQALFDVSAYGEEGWVERVNGIKDLAGSAAGFLVMGAAGNNPFDFVTDVDTLAITFATGCTVTFPCVIGNVRIEGAYSGLNVVTFDWAKAQGAAPTIAWVEA